ncbi:NAD(P)-binding protein, partial [Enterococcus faecalis]|uniref:NAD(P)-binding protein n=1 Tax=Enterococcus faecalis TaxID=1351 RepID=UPI001C8B56C8
MSQEDISPHDGVGRGRAKGQSMDTHYDLIVIGSGPGGASLAQALAPTGKRILILERGGYLPRE